MNKPCKELYINKCRTCFNQGNDLQSLKSRTKSNTARWISYGELLKEVTNINIADDKGQEMPQSICNCCTRKLELSHEFIKQAQEVNDKLRLLLNNNGGKLDCLEESEIDIRTSLEIKLEFMDDNVEDNYIDTEKTYIKSEIPDENPLNKNLNSNLTNTAIVLQESGEEAILNPEIDEITFKQDTNISEDETDGEEELPWSNETDVEEQQVSCNETDQEEQLLCSNYTHKRAKGKQSHKKGKSTEKDCSNENKDKDVDIAVLCRQCNKIFKNSKELARHLKNTHLTEDQKCSCPLCGIKFTRSCNMYKHMRKLHDPESVKTLLPTKEKPFECDKCHRRYTQKRQLNCHIKEKHKNGDDITVKDSTKAVKKKSEVRPLCFVCGSSFSNKAHLIIHMTRHTGERPFKCDLCDRAFPRISDLTCHRRIHTGEKPFKCELCEKAFRVSTKLATHMRSHTNERPYKCKHCERSFKYSKDLNIHMRVHTGERPYCCTVCGSTFTQSNSLRAHRMKLGHIDESASLGVL